ncbi:MAG: hypothetical protein FWD31_12095, partial [Planctomycetaceae bacterium]|nr:hypothetical protein [Planctomycetaceae bacterium]
MRLLEITRDRSIAEANAKYELACGENSNFQRKTLLADANADAQKTMLDAQAGLTAGLNDAIANLLHLEKKAQTAAWQTAVNQMYSPLQAAITTWRNLSGVEQAWGDYIAALFDHLVTRYQADNAAYIANANAAANAEKTLADAINSAWLTAQKSANTSAWQAQKDAIAQQKKFVLDVQKATLKRDLDSAENEYRRSTTLETNKYTCYTSYKSASITHNGLHNTNYEIYIAAQAALDQQYWSNQITKTVYDQLSADIYLHHITIARSIGKSLATEDASSTDSFFKSQATEQLRYSDQQAKIKLQYETSLIQSISAYLCGSVDVGADYSVDLLSIAECYEGATVGASGDYNDTMVSADSILQNSLVGNADTHNKADLVNERTFLGTVMSGYLNAVKTWGDAQNSAYGNYVKANATVAGTHYDTILGAAMNYVGAVFDKGVTEATSNIGTLSGLAGSTASAISGFLNGWIGTSYGGERQYTEADRTLSKANIQAAANYLLEVGQITYHQTTELNSLNHQVQNDRINYKTRDTHASMYLFAMFPLVGNQPLTYYDYVSFQYPTLYSYPLDIPLALYSSFETTSINDRAAAQKVGAYQTYVTAVWNNEQNYLDTCYATASGLLDGWYNSLKGLNSTVGNATQGANQSLRSAAKTADPTDDMITFMKGVAQADASYMYALAVNFGAYQQGWRVEELHSLPSGSPLAPVWMNEIAWAGQIGAVRSAYTSVLGMAGKAYTNTVLDAYGTFNNAAWNAADSFASALDQTGQTYDDTMLTLEEIYSRNRFNAEKAKTTAHFNAAKNKSIGNATVDANGKAAIAAASQAEAVNARTIKDDMMEYILSLPLPDVYGGYSVHWVDGVNNFCWSTGVSLQQLQQTSTRAAAVTDAANQHAAAETANDAAKTAAEAAADTQLWRATQTADVNYAVAAFGAATTYMTNIKGLQTTYGNSIGSAADAYLKTVVNAGRILTNESCRLTGMYYDAIKRINLGYGVDANFFTNGATSTDVQVCFQKGTPILMANETSKSIEEVEVGDEVYARPHDNPTGELVKCKVVRTFVNRKETWSLTIRNSEMQECLVIRGTSEHPFYVQDK